MKLIVGLGNPGEKYKNTRHNLGFMVIDELKIENGKRKVDKESDSQLTTHNSQLILAKPQTYMNESGKAVKYLCQKHKVSPENVLIIHDDLDIIFGSFKLQLGKGPHQHNGVTSIENHLGTKDFWRLRVGIENRGQKAEGPKGRSKGEDYVLEKFTSEELKTLNVLIESEIITAVNKWAQSVLPNPRISIDYLS